MTAFLSQGMHIRMRKILNCMLQYSLRVPYTAGVEVPDTDLIFPPIGRFLPQTEPNSKGLAA